jgi:hypothetical protein
MLRYRLVRRDRAILGGVADRPIGHPRRVFPYVSRKDAKTQRREQNSTRMHIESLSSLCVSASLRELLFLPAKTQRWTERCSRPPCQRGNRPCAGKPASIRRGGAGRLRRDSARCGHGRIRAGTVAYGDRRIRGPRGQRDRCVPITFPVPFDATAADIQKRDNTPRHAVIWLVHVVVSPRRPSRKTHARELSGNHRITS